MSEEPTPANRPGKNSWAKNTYFWIAAILLLLGLFGLVKGDKSIRDPGQIHESNLWMIYLAASVVMLINGLISHRAYLAQWDSPEENN
jgi:uncharacterized membrane protein